MKICLLYPPVNAQVPAKSTLLGLGYLASTLRKRGHEVEIQDLMLQKDNITVNFAGGIPDVVGVSSMFTDHKKEAINFIVSIKNTFPKIHVIVGGAHASTFPEEMSEYADTVVVGEGEEVICDIIENRKTGVIRADRIQNLDKLPFPAWDLMENDVRQINEMSKKSPFLMRRPLAHIITSRGCPNACAFCAVKVAWGRQWKARSAENVVDEIEFLYKNGFKEIHFNDDNCSIDKKRMYAICNLILERKINIKIACPTGIHIMTLDKDLLRLMKKAGFYRLCFGIETGDKEMQKKINKNIDLDKALQVIKDANDLGFWTSATFIVGFPEDTSDTMAETCLFSIKSEMDFPIFYQWNPQLKTKLYEEFGFGKYGKVSLQPVINKCYSTFLKASLSRPKTYMNLLKKIHSFEDFRYMLGLAWFALTKFIFKKRICNENIRGRK